MNTPHLHIQITEKPGTQKNKVCTYAISWEESSQEETRKGYAEAEGSARWPQDPPRMALGEVCAWLAGVAMRGTQGKEGLLCLLERMHDRSDFPAYMTNWEELARVTISNAKGRQWSREWPYQMKMDDLYRMGQALTLAYRTKAVMDKPATPKAKPARL